MFFAAGAEVIEAVDTRTKALLQEEPVMAPLDRIDGLAVADGFLFALDATPTGYLQVYRIDANGGRAARPWRLRSALFWSIRGGGSGCRVRWHIAVEHARI